jgi:NAD(P)-dependent dehydrogenase (short-subunit alcohol dehydrogenase family)
LGSLLGRADVVALLEGAPVHRFLVDLSTAQGPQGLVDEAVSVFGGVDTHVNNVRAVRPRTDGFLSLTDDARLASLTINFLAAVRTTRPRYRACSIAAEAS